MKKQFLSFITSAALAIPVAAAMPQLAAKADNPCIQTIYSTDPAPMVYGDTVYLYTGRDKDNSDFYYMPDWHCYSSQDMQNWTDHGMILSWDSFTWGKQDSAWAAQCIERNGKFYYYVTLEHKNGGGRAIGVAVADSPTGPFKDALGKPLVGPNWDYIDPTVFIDDDGQAWLMFGNPSCYYVKLNEDMVSYSGSIGKFNMNAQSFGPSNNKASSYGEGPWFYKRKDKYYLVFAAFYGGDGGESLGYSTAPSPTGPWTYGGQVMKPHNCFTNHPGVIDFKGHSYLFYHDASLPGGGSFDRSVCIDEFEYGSDGSIPTISPTKTGPEQLQALNPYKRVEAETICFSKGVKTEKCSEGGINIGNIQNGSYIKVKGVDFGSGTNKFTASVSSDTDGGDIEIYLDSLTGKKIGTCKVTGTGGWQSWKEVSCDISGASGEHDLYFKFTGGSGYLLNMDWWRFGDGEAVPVVTTTNASNVQNVTTTTSAVNVTPDNGDYLLDCSFESGVDGFDGRAGAKVAASSSKYFNGGGSLYCSGRSESYQGAVIELGSKFKAGESYSFSANVMYDTGRDYDTFHFTMQYDLDGETKYEKIDTVKPFKGSWVQLSNTNFKIPSGAENISIYVETDKSTDDFYIDDIRAAKAGTVIEGAVGGAYMPGDINMDGCVNSLDLVRARKLIKSSGSENGASSINADVDRSTEFEINDMVLLQRYLIGRIVEFPDNTPEPPVSEFEYDPEIRFREAPGNYLNSCSQAGKIVKETYNGINGSNSLNVYLPYGYDPNRKYNIFYLMHGGGENENTIFSSDVKLNNILDHMIMNGELEPMIVVTPTFNKTEAGKFWNEFRQSVVPFVEKKYSTYANGDVSESNLKATRMHRAYGGFSMGSLSTWGVADHDMDIVGYFMPLSGNNWEGMNTLTKEIDSLGLKKNQYYIFAATGSEDIAYNNMKPEMEDLKNRTQYFTYTSDFSKGNFYWLVAPGKTHWWGYVRHYVYDALPYFFHETGE
ncbi:MAG: family 43 glycosylhydrolase [Ruminococcus sp.]|uniref:family 43 glycosylhydrolase n=1 Tax=Ruminococcus sp. TaxID=41978 RepID=UPI0025F95454|nr:family 43 glycosylhydrolase [Ruminococcus sp.]MCR4796520.1 family 43 glycosylhydrolase [Ruminococcus sp.]